MLLKLWTFLLGWGVLSTLPRYGPDKCGKKVQSLIVHVVVFHTNSHSLVDPSRAAVPERVGIWRATDE